MDLRGFLFSRLPNYYKDNDTYKDSNNRGILERFLGTLDVELQEELVDQLHQLIDQLDPKTTMNKFLPIMAQTVGNPTNILGTDESLRERILQAISLYKIKGTVRSYQLLFNLLGYRIELEEHIPLNSLYDIGLLYDDDHNYDTSYCTLGCIEYTIKYMDGATTGPMDTEMRGAVIAAIKKDLEPITAKLRELIYYVEPIEP